MRGRYLLLAPSRRRPGAGLDGAELPMRAPPARPGLAAAPATVNEGSRAELRARLRHEVEQGLVAREEEIDPTPSSRPHQLASLGIGSIETAPASDGDIEGALREVRRG